MANSYVEYTSLSGTTYATPAFLNINDINVKGYNGSTWTTLTINSRNASAKTITLSAAPSSYQKIRVYRSTTADPLVDFTDGAILTANDLDSAYNQGLFVAQEVAENASLDGSGGVSNIVNSQLAGGITNDKLAGSIASSKLAGYAEGTFTPVANGYSGTMNFEFAHYTKVGRMVNFAFKMTGDGTTDSSQIAISGFPFAVLAEHPVSLSSNAGDVFEGANAMVNTAEICYFYNKNGSAFTYTNLGSSYMRVQGTYMTA